MDYVSTIRPALVSFSDDFDYIHATSQFPIFDLFPVEMTSDIKLSLYNLMEGSDTPVAAFVHGLDTESRIGDRPNYVVTDVELFLIKEKIDQGERLKKKFGSSTLSLTERKLLESIYNDVANMMSRVINRIAAMACELVTSGKITVNENNVSKTVDFGLPESHKDAWTGWGDPTHDIMGDINAIKKRSKNKIKRAFMSDKIIGYIMNNNFIKSVANSSVPIQFVTQEWTLSYLKAIFNIDFVVTSGTYKDRASEGAKEYNLFDQDVISFVTTDGEIGKTFVTPAPEVDSGIEDSVRGYVAVTTWYEYDRAVTWVKASAMALPCPKDINMFYIVTVGE